jgi:4-amino-4-deoxy-L-arabinose transferase-like glycosyltransferase
LKIKLYLLLIILCAILIRLYFQVGHIFSDDAYYSYLAYTFYKGNYPGSYIGYPIFLLRTSQTALIAFAYSIFGINETATIIFPFVFSIINIFLTYSLAKLVFKNEEISLIAAFLFSFFPTDILFSTIVFPDLINTFFINLGIFLLWKSYKENRLSYSLLSGISFFISMQFKENIYYIVFLLLLLIAWLIVKHKKEFKYLILPVCFIILNFIVEGIKYLITRGNFYYRFEITYLNYLYSYYDFFPHTVYENLGHQVNYWIALLYQVFVINLKSIFLRRFYLLIPLVALYQAVKNIRNKKFPLLNYWFIGLSVLMIAFTTSFTSYKPLDLHRNWYIYPLIMLAVILSAQFIKNFGKYYKILLLGLYFIFSLVMCNQYEIFFDRHDLNGFKKFLRANENKTIFTDHFTKYSVDLIREYKNSDETKKISGANFDFDKIHKSDWLIYNKKHIDELKLQKFKFPNFNVLNTDTFKIISSFSDFKIYEKQY